MQGLGPQEQERSAPLQAGMMRVVSHAGDWQCECGAQSRLWDTCACGRVGPCRDWVRGRCKYQENCRCACLPAQLRSSRTHIHDLHVVVTASCADA